jgi:nucleoside transporter
MLMGLGLYIRLSLMMFLQFAVWGCFSPLLASHLVGPLKMSGKQTGWIYATLWLGCIISPFIGGQIADRWAATHLFLAAVQLTGGVVLLVAARRMTFWGLFSLMGLHALLYAPTFALTNSLMFANLDNPETQAGQIRVWGTIGWIAAGWSMALWRHSGKFKVKGIDGLTLAGYVSIVMGIFCLFLPHTSPPEQPGNPLAFMAALNMLAEPGFLIFLIISFVVTTQLQFYYIAAVPFLEDIGVKDKSVSAVMTVAQFAEIFSMLFLLSWLLPRVGYRWALVLGVIAWPLRFMIFAAMRPKSLIIASLALHGLGYTFFFFVGQMYVDSLASPDIRASAQALIAVVTLGFGNFIGTQITGAVLDIFKTNGKFRWRPIFLVPCVLTILCAIAFLLFFRPNQVIQ